MLAPALWAGAADGAGAADWAGDLSSVPESAWNDTLARHLLDRAGFGATPEEAASLAALGRDAAIRRVVRFEGVAESEMPAFVHSGVHDPGLEPFPPSRPATTALAKRTGAALGVKVKPSGNRRLQPVVNRFFYWLRASRLETDRVAYWWAQRMLTSPRPLQEKMALFWHGHFATNEDKVRDYRKHLQQLEMFHELGTGDFRTLLMAVARGPAMLSFLDAGVNIKGSPNENFAREIMELFTMGVGQYTEADIREAARAFTGWNYSDLEFVVNADQHDATEKTFLGARGPFDGEQVIDLILAQPVTAEFLAGKIYRYFVRDELTPALQRKLGDALREGGYEIGTFLTMLFSSRDFYSDRAIASRIKGPVEFIVSTYKHLGLERIPGIPDFNEASAMLGQRLFHPPTVAGWAHGRSWVTPGLLIARGNFVYSVLFPDINFIPHDRYPPDRHIRDVSRKVRLGVDISQATRPDTSGTMAMANVMADRDEDFNTRYGSYKGWQMAIQRVRPISRHSASADLSAMVAAAGLDTVGAVVDFLAGRYLRVPLASAYREAVIETLRTELGTDQIQPAASYLEEPLRLTVHLLMSAPEYQIN